MGLTRRPEEHIDLDDDEHIHTLARLPDGLMALTDRRLIVKASERSVFDMDIEAIRRIQFDIEAQRPATLVLVPHSPLHPPHVLAVPVDQLEATTRVLWMVGERLAGIKERPD